MELSVQELRTVNERLREFLDHLGRLTEEQPVHASMVADLLNTVLQAGECLRVQTGAASDPEWEQQRQAYRINLERLRGLLPLLEVHLQMERIRLESERSHLQAASEWVTSSRQIF